MSHTTRQRAARLLPERGRMGRNPTAAAERVSDDLRLGTGDFLGQRRRLAALTMTAIGSFAVVGLYQFGLIRNVPEIRVAPFDADRVDASGEAYAVGNMPDAALGLANSSLTLALVGMSDRHRSREKPWIPLLLTAKVLADAAGAAFLFTEQVSRHRRLCSWCTLAAAANLAAVPVSWPEAKASLHALSHP